MVLAPAESWVGMADHGGAARFAVRIADDALELQPVLRLDGDGVRCGSRGSRAITVRRWAA
jgi:hypothetical protein